MAKMNHTQIIEYLTHEVNKSVITAESIRRDHGTDSMLFAIAAHTAKKLDEILNDIR